MKINWNFISAENSLSLSVSAKSSLTVNKLRLSLTNLEEIMRKHVRNVIKSWLPSARERTSTAAERWCLSNWKNEYVTNFKQTSRNRRACQKTWARRRKHFQLKRKLYSNVISSNSARIRIQLSHRENFYDFRRRNEKFFSWCNYSAPPGQQ